MARGARRARARESPIPHKRRLAANRLVQYQTTTENSKVVRVIRIELDRQIFIPIAAAVARRSEKFRLVFKWKKTIGDRKLSNGEELRTPLEKGIDGRLAGFPESFSESEKAVGGVTFAVGNP